MAETLQFSTYYNVDADSIPLVLLHGWGLNSAVWQPFIAQLSDSFKANFQVITIDLPGCGHNHDQNLALYTLANIAKQIERIIDKPAIYLGWSLGGLVATELALTYPDKVLGLITVASSPKFIEETGIDNHQSIIWPGIKPKVLKDFHQQLHDDTKKTISNFLKIQAMGSPHIRQNIKQMSQLVLQYQMPTKATLEASLGLLEESDYRDKLTSINQPFLCLYGGNDNLVPSTVINYVAKLAQQSEQRILAQASHAPFISHLDEFTHEVSDWLMRQFLPLA